MIKYNFKEIIEEIWFYEDYKFIENINEN